MEVINTVVVPLFSLNLTPVRSAYYCTVIILRTSRFQFLQVCHVCLAQRLQRRSNVAFHNALNGAAALFLGLPLAHAGQQVQEQRRKANVNDQLGAGTKNDSVVVVVVVRSIIIIIITIRLFRGDNIGRMGSALGTRRFGGGRRAGQFIEHPNERFGSRSLEFILNQGNLQRASTATTLLLLLLFTIRKSTYLFATNSRHRLESETGKLDGGGGDPHNGIYSCYRWHQHLMPVLLGFGLPDPVERWVRSWHQLDAVAGSRQNAVAVLKQHIGDARVEGSRSGRVMGRGLEPEVRRAGLLGALRACLLDGNVL